MNLAGLILKMLGWKVDITAPDYPKCLICVAPHTSNMDFVIGKLAYMSVRRRAGFLMKSTWFFFPLGALFRAMGGVPVHRGERAGRLVETLVNRFNNSERLVLAITPEGTRSRTSRWHSGFLRIAYEAKIPILLGAIDFGQKRVIIERTFTPTGDLDADMTSVKNYYRNFTGRHPEKFTI